MSTSSGTPLSGDDLDKISKALDEAKVRAAEIAKEPGYWVSGIRPDVDSCISAVLHSIEKEQAQRLRSAPNLAALLNAMDDLRVRSVDQLKHIEQPTTKDVARAFALARLQIGAKDGGAFYAHENVTKFTDLLEGLIQRFVRRLKGLKQPTVEDVEQAFFSNALSLDEKLARPVRAEAMDRLKSLHEHFTTQLLARLTDVLGVPPVQASGKQIEQAYVDTLDEAWKRQHRVKSVSLLTVQAVAIVLMGIHSLIYRLSPEAGVTLLVTGIAINIGTLVYFGKKV